MILIYFLLLILLALSLILMVGFSLIEVAIKLVSSRTTLNVVFLIVISIVKISKVLITLLCPKGILLFFFFPIDEIIHFGASSLSKLHIPDSELFFGDW